VLEAVEPGVEVELDSNAAILPARAKKVEEEEGAAPRKISKGEQRKLKQIARERAMKSQREQVIHSPNHLYTPHPPLPCKCCQPHPNLRSGRGTG
jgi:hypothetical protein